MSSERLKMAVLSWFVLDIPTTQMSSAGWGEVAGPVSLPPASICRCFKTFVEESQWLRHCLECQHAISQCLGSSLNTPPTHTHSGFLWTRILRSSRCLGSCHQQERSRLSYQLLASAWPSHSYDRQLGNKLVDEAFFVSFLPVCLLVFQNKLTKRTISKFMDNGIERQAHFDAKKNVEQHAYVGSSKKYTVNMHYEIKSIPGF